ncbi:MAG: dihydrolipoyl dehydrogenase [Desulfobacteria bacterium]
MGTEGKRVVVIGGGPGGYPAAIRAAKLGLDVVLIDRGGLGGACLHRGCIPTKLLLKETSDYRKAATFASAGMGLAVPPADLDGMMRRKEQVVGHLERGTRGLLRKNGVRVVAGTASFIDPSRVLVAETGEVVLSSTFIVATGSAPARLPVEGCDLPGVVDSDAALSIERVPRSVAIIGGGVIGVEFAQMFRNLGADVTIVEMLPRLLASEDDDVSVALRGALESSGIAVRTGSTVERIGKTPMGLRLEFREGGAVHRVDAGIVLVAVGRKPVLECLNPGNAGLILENGVIRVNARMETGVPGIYAVGDAVGGLMLAHKATMEGECAAQNAAGVPTVASYVAIPRVAYTDPEVACVGLTEAEARVRHDDVRIGKFPFSMSGRAILEGVTHGFAKVIAEGETGCVLGAAIVGRHAAQAIGEASLAVRLEATCGDLADLVHPHPTFSEALREAALDADGRAIHMPPVSKSGAVFAFGR